MNAHRRRILVAANARELYHLARLRMDGHAQWEIRELVGRMVELARRAAPTRSAWPAARTSSGS